MVISSPIFKKGDTSKIEKYRRISLLDSWNFETPLKSIQLIRSCNENAMCQVCYINKMSKKFEVKIGLRQGDTLFPILFNLALKQVVRYVKDNRTMELVENRTLTSICK